MYFLVLSFLSFNVTALQIYTSRPGADLLQTHTIFEK